VEAGRAGDPDQVTVSIFSGWGRNLGPWVGFPGALSGDRARRIQDSADIGDEVKACFLALATTACNWNANHPRQRTPGLRGKPRGKHTLAPGRPRMSENLSRFTMKTRGRWPGTEARRGRRGDDGGGPGKKKLMPQTTSGGALRVEKGGLGRGAGNWIGRDHSSSSPPPPPPLPLSTSSSRPPSTRISCSRAPAPLEQTL